MTQVRDPVITVKVQRRFRVPERFGRASVWTYRPASVEQGTAIRCDVSHAASRDGSVKSLVADIVNVRPEEVLNLQDNGTVEVVAGYERVSGPATGIVPTPQPIFRGTIDVAFNARQGPSNVLHIEASSASTRADDAYVHVRDSKTIGDAMRLLARGIGGQAFVPPSADKAVFDSPYSSKLTVRKEFEHLVEELSAVTGRPHLLLHSDQAAFTFTVIDAADPRLPVIPVDVSGPMVSNATPMLMRGEPDFDLSLDARGVLRPDEVTKGPDAAEEQVSTLGYAIEGAFDPRYALGVRIRPVGAQPSGLTLVTSVRHTLGRGGFRSSVNGPFFSEVQR